MGRVKNVLIYGRTSQEENLPPFTKQQQICREYGDKYGWQIVKAIHDEGASGENLERPGIKEVFKITSHKQASIVVVWDLECLTKNIQDLAFILEQMQQHMWELVCVDSGLNTSNTSGQLVFNILKNITCWKLPQRALELKQEQASSEPAPNETSSEPAPNETSSEPAPNEIASEQNHKMEEKFQQKNFEEHILTLPQPLVLSYSRLTNAIVEKEASLESLSLLKDSFTSLIKFVNAIFLGEYLDSKVRQENRDKQILAILSQPSISLSQQVELLGKLIEWLSLEEKTISKQLQQVFFANKHYKCLQEFAEFCMALDGADFENQKLFDKWCQRLREIYEQLCFLQNWHLIRIVEGEIVEWWLGTGSSQETIVDLNLPKDHFFVLVGDKPEFPTTVKQSALISITPFLWFEDSLLFFYNGQQFGDQKLFIDILEYFTGGHRLSERPVAIWEKRFGLPKYQSSFMELIASYSKNQTQNPLDKTLKQEGAVFAIQCFDEAIFSCGSDKLVKKWSLSTGKLQQTYSGHYQIVTTLAISPNKTIASASGDGTICIWDSETGENKETLKGHTNCTSLVFTPGGTKMLSTGTDGQVICWNTATWTPIYQFPLESSSRLALSKDGKTVFCGDKNGKLYFWPTDSPAQIEQLLAHEAAILSICHDGQFIATAGEDQSIKVWNFLTKELLQTLKGHSDWIYQIKLDGTQDILASASGDKTVKIWDISTGEELATLSSHQDWVYSVDFANEAQMVVSSSEDKTIKIWDMTKLPTVAKKIGYSAQLSEIAYSPDKKNIATASFDQSIRFCNGLDGSLVSKFCGSTKKIQSVRYSPNGRYIATCGNDKVIHIWLVKDKQKIATLTGHKATVFAIDYSPYGERIVSCSEDKTVKIWDIAAEQLTATLDHEDWVQDIAFSPDGKFLVSACYDKAVYFWNAESEVLVYKNQEHKEHVTKIAFSHFQEVSGGVVASASLDKTVILWDVKTGAKLTTFSHNSEVYTIAFSPDGKFLVSGCRDKSVVVWDTIKNDQAYSYIANSSVHSLCFSPDGKQLTLGDQEGSLYVLGFPK